MKSRITPALAVILCACSAADPEPLLPPIEVVEHDLHPSVFITAFDLHVDPALVDSVRFAVRPRPGAQARPLGATYAIDALSVDGGTIVVPIFGLYADYANLVELTVTFTSGGSTTVPATVQAGAWVDAMGPYDELQVTRAVDPARRPDFSYIHLENETEQGPLIVDIDGYVRWAGLDDARRWPNFFDGERFVIGDEDAISFLALDGTKVRVPLVVEGFDAVLPHRAITFGPQGYLLSVDVRRTGEPYFEDAPVLIEVDEHGAVLNTWDLGQIIADHISAAGGDPSGLVRPDEEWFVLNSTLYSPEDDSLIVSSREHFVMKVGYTTKQIQWILGDETKHWYVNFPSLRALSLGSSDPKPIGQHALSFVDGDLLLFNNGEPSIRQPDDAPVGQRLPSSLAMIYAVDEVTMTAQVSWQYDAGYHADFCSSVYRAGGDYLLTYASLGDDLWRKRAVIQGIDEGGALLFELVVPESEGLCRPWNSKPVALEDLQFDG
ncbi:MAG: aryl-sulfate sulfotransferase [Deltaproteobacteria bacterium]|nr:aryl-sulfate sulfotransferase [Deltaproteobacteria bacterium]